MITAHAVLPNIPAAYMRTFFGLTGCSACNVSRPGRPVMTSPLAQAVLAALATLTILLLDPFAEADAVGSDREQWSHRCERAADELRAQARGEHSSDFARPALNQRTLSSCADRGLLPSAGTVM